MLNLLGEDFAGVDLLELADGIVLRWPVTPPPRLEPLLQPSEPSPMEISLGRVEVLVCDSPGARTRARFFEPADLLSEFWADAAYHLTEREGDEARQRARHLLAMATSAPLPAWLEPFL